MQVHRNLWIAVMTILAAVGIAMVAAAIAAGSALHDHFGWTSSEMYVAYGCFAGATYVLFAIL